jgi:CBS domain-containing protein
MLKVQDIMTSDIICVSSSAVITEVSQKMMALGQGVIPVCDNSNYRGVITERDIVRFIATARTPLINSSLLTEPSGSVMNKSYPVISPDDEIGVAVAAMVDNSAWVLPVVKHGKLVGLFTMDNLTRETAQAIHSGAHVLPVVKSRI